MRAGIYYNLVFFYFLFQTQLTDFENAAFVSFVVLLTRVCLSYNLHLTIPISNVDENMKRASKRDAVREQKFFFRTNLGKLHGACFTSLSFIYFVGLKIFENKDFIEKCVFLFCFFLLLAVAKKSFK